MNDIILNKYNDFQIADFDDDMVGLCKAIVNFIKALKLELPGEEFPVDDPPSNFFKLDPHLPRMDLRINIRKALAATIKAQDDEDYSIKIKNLYVLLLTITYFYHMPTEKILQASLDIKEFTREESQNLLLSDSMSPNWIKEPSGRDFSSLMI